MKRLLITPVLALATTATTAEDQVLKHWPLTDQLIEQGTGNQGEFIGLRFEDSFSKFHSAFDRGGTSGFGADVYTPYAWIAQQAWWAAKRYQTFTLDGVTDEMREPVLRVYAKPDVPKQVTRTGMMGTSGVEHVILRSTQKKNFTVVQPTYAEEDIEYVQNAFGAEAGFPSKYAESDLEEIANVRKGDKKGEFLLVVIGDTGEEKKFKIKTKHFKKLP